MRELLFWKAYPFALRAAQVRCCADRFRSGVAIADRDDLQQEALAAVWRVLPHYDASRASLRTFVEHVVATHLVSLRRSCLRRPPLQPLDDNQHLVGNAWVCAIELRSDIHRVLNSLSDTERQIAVALIEHTPTEVSHLFGIARSTIYERIGHIRAVFRNAGLRPRGALRW